MVEGMSLAKIDYMLNNKQDWMNRWLATKGYYGSCPHSYVDETIGAECRAWYATGEQQYRKISDKRDIARKMIDTIEEMRQYNQGKYPKSMHNMPVQQEGFLKPTCRLMPKMPALSK